MGSVSFLTSRKTPRCMMRDKLKAWKERIITRKERSRRMCYIPFEQPPRCKMRQEAQ